MQISKRLLYIGGPVLALLFIAPFLLYFCNFHGSLSQSHDKWGQFGDFIGGVLNPIIAGLSLAVSIFIAKEVYRLNLQQAEAQREYVHSQIRTEFLKDFASALNSQMYELEKLILAGRDLAVIRGEILFNLQEFQNSKGVLFEISRTEFLTPISKMKTCLIEFPNDVKSQFGSLSYLKSERDKLLSLLYKSLLNPIKTGSVSR